MIKNIQTNNKSMKKVNKEALLEVDEEVLAGFRKDQVKLVMLKRKL